jgi:hypothetical protein
LRGTCFAEVGIRTKAGKPSNVVHTLRIVQAWLRQAVVCVNVAGGTLETFQTFASSRQVSIHALGPILTQICPSFYFAIIHTSSTQTPFPAVGTIAGEVVQRINTLGAIHARRERAFVYINLTQFAGESWHARARESVRFVNAGGTIETGAAIALVSVYGAQRS